MNTKVTTVHFANNGDDSLDVGFDILDANGAPVKGHRVQAKIGAALRDGILAKAQAIVDAAVGDVADTVAATGLAKSIERLDAVRAEIVAEEARLAALKATP